MGAGGEDRKPVFGSDLGQAPAQVTQLLAGRSHFRVRSGRDFDLRL
jgi:hypothetical protein